MIRNRCARAGGPASQGGNSKCKGPEMSMGVTSPAHWKESTRGQEEGNERERVVGGGEGRDPDWQYKTP